MVLTRRTTTAIITWKPNAIKDPITGTYSDVAGSESITFDCRPEPQAGKYQPTENGDRIPFSYKVFADLFDGVDTIPDEGVKITFDNQELTIVKLIKYQTKVEIRC